MDVDTGEPVEGGAGWPFAQVERSSVIPSGYKMLKCLPEDVNMLDGCGEPPFAVCLPLLLVLSTLRARICEVFQNRKRHPLRLTDSVKTPPW